MIDYIQKTEEIRQFTQAHVKKSRYEHSIRVAEMCARMCRQFHLDARKGYLAGIGHDMCKDFPDQELIELAGRDGRQIIDYDRKKPALLHGRAAAVMLKEHFKVYDPEILEAVANHTSGIIGMCDLTKCLFLADKIEPGRPQSTNEYREGLLAMSLDDMLYSVLEENYEYLTKKGYEIYPGTRELIDFYSKKNVEGGR
ncbi:MAG: bis(5'-nucleosyl)-tetraphosphatase (symmetrical) YqeK [Treponema sp.]|nr:bis(5'-nucleosyl)-tetraphosphatase (symmetrical) YqeK [Treponema sp.]